MEGIRCGQCVFYNDFDSANLSRVEFVTQQELALLKLTPGPTHDKFEVPDAEFNIWTRPDCDGTEFENGNRTWFYFGIKACEPALNVRLNMVDLNRQGKMYSQGMAPVFRILPGKPKWERIHDKPTYNLSDDIFTLSFKYRTPDNPECCTYFAFTYPFSYVDLQKLLVNIDHKYLAIQPIGEDDIYYVRETVCKSLEGRNVDLITISSYHGITAEREERLRGLFPDKNVPRPHKFVGKKVIFVSARVHPGETPSSFVFNGLLNLLLCRDDLQAQYLRKFYVFKLVPFLNPDGVARGHYRTDTRGVNLNRIYMNPSIVEHPTIYAARALIRYYHYGAERDDKTTDERDWSGKMTRCADCSRVNENNMSTMSLRVDGAVDTRTTSWCSKWRSFCRHCGRKLVRHGERDEVEFETATVDGDRGDVNSNESGLFLYVDMHGHASKKGIFMYGNHFADADRRVECMLLPKLMGLNNHHFHFQACNFTERNMYLRDKRDGMSRAGSGRVAVLSLTGIVKSYTLECNYNTGRLVNALPPATVKEAAGRAHATSPVPPKYNPQIFEEVGKSLGVSILDLTGQNPFSRLPNSEFHSLAGLREWLRSSCGECRDPRPKFTQGIAGGARGGKKPPNRAGRAAPSVDRKENLPGCSKPSAAKLNRSLKAKSRKEMSLRAKNVGPAQSADKLVASGKRSAQKVKNQEGGGDAVRLREICFIKSGEGKKTMIAKYKNKKGGEDFDDSLIVSWDAPASKATVFTSRNALPRSPSEPSTSKQGVFRAHNFSKTVAASSSSRVKLKKQSLRRLSSAAELAKAAASAVAEKKKKKRKLRVK
ncbi:cytosolic carboxypeptidase-like protein 5 [Cylas formicarius]|uniref:cytosolic carboxypeptidase-like protein 5 n=1 Tax=Cylas formicarius TaxID=197179 RepID=UPI00295858F5|nr:cytosolic carboxypeptidase-like protein 5 [Cylas formicarius]XP_060524612.1 cytosolic carboxypeptidase-like protein 5 [Cylas formicarius]